MIQVTKHGSFMALEGEFTIEWLRLVTGEELPFTREVDDVNQPCGLAIGICYRYETPMDDRGGLHIHSNGFCVSTKDKQIMDKVVTHINSRIPEGIFQ